MLRLDLGVFRMGILVFLMEVIREGWPITAFIRRQLAMRHRIFSFFFIAPQPPAAPSTSPNHVLVIGATSRLQAVDPSLRRAGRFDREISLGVPDEKCRDAILRILCAKTALDPALCLRQLARDTPGYCGADLMALCREAAMIAVDRILKDNLAPVGGVSSGVDGPSSKENLFQWLLHQPPIR